MHFLVIQEIAKCNDLSFAGKKLEIIPILNSASPKGRRGSRKERKVCKLCVYYLFHSKMAFSKFAFKHQMIFYCFLRESEIGHSIFHVVTSTGPPSTSLEVFM